MRSLPFPTAVSLAALLLLAAPPHARAEDLPPQYREMVARGLDWLGRQQGREGQWAGRGRYDPFELTALAGLALMMEGSTQREGKYAERIRKASEWLLDQATKESGPLARPEPKQGTSLLTHTRAVTFLVHVYAEEDGTATAAGPATPGIRSTPRRST